MFGVCPYLNETKRLLMIFTLFKLFFILSFSRKKKRGKRARLPYLRNIYYKTQVCVRMTKRRRFLFLFCEKKSPNPLKTGFTVSYPAFSTRRPGPDASQVLFFFSHYNYPWPNICIFSRWYYFKIS